MKVMKFGGASLKDKNNFLKTANIILNEKDIKIVVLSAIYGVTDLLEKSIFDSKNDEILIKTRIEEIKNKHYIIASQSIENLTILNSTLQLLDERFQKLERLLYGISYTEEITKKIYALIMSFGERLAVIIMSNVINSLGGNSVFLESDKVGIITDNNYENASPIMPLVKQNCEKKILPLLNNGIIPIITGFFGCNQEGKTTLFGRNSSDYSAAVICAGINASKLEIWKDVDGFMSADPKIVSSSHLIEKLSYYEAAELSYFGAKILHPRTVNPLIKSSIPLTIKNFNKPENQGTEVSREGEKKDTIIKSVTYNENISVLKIEGSGVGSKPGIISEIGSRLAKLGINIYSIITSQTCINLLIDKKNSIISYEAIKDMENGVIENITHKDDDVVIAVVGEGIDKTPGLAAKLFNSVAQKNINIEMISLGASEVAIYFIVKQKDLEESIKSIHNEFFMKKEN